MTSEPVSWLLLERYALGELEQDERADVERRLAASSADRACLEAILNDVSELPPLPAVLPRKKPLSRASWLAIASMAAALALTVLRPFDASPERPTAPDGVKGGEVALTLISERTGRSPRVFRDGERFKLLVTCPLALSDRLEVVVFQDGQRYRPLAPASDFPCGNEAAWPGAFTLDGASDVDVCVTWGEADDERVCARLRHE
jgi:hypothetical protein